MQHRGQRLHRLASRRLPQTVLSGPTLNAEPRLFTSRHNGVTYTLWAHDGRELFYRNGEKMMTASFDTASGSPGTPSVLFEGRYVPIPNVRGYDLAADGRFIMVRTPDESLPRQINVVLNWFEELKEKMNGR